jgi:hypothetical protein
MKTRMKTWIIRRGTRYYTGGADAEERSWSTKQRRAWRCYDRGFAEGIAITLRCARVVRLKPKAKAKA